MTHIFFPLTSNSWRILFYFILFFNHSLSSVKNTLPSFILWPALDPRRLNQQDVCLIMFQLDSLSLLRVVTDQLKVINQSLETETSYFPLLNKSIWTLLGTVTIVTHSSVRSSQTLTYYDNNRRNIVPAAPPHFKGLFHVFWTRAAEVVLTSPQYLVYNQLTRCR